MEQYNQFICGSKLWEKYEHKIKLDAHKLFDEMFSGYCPKLFSWKRLDTLIELVSEEATSIKSNAFNLFNDHLQIDVSKRYVNAIDLDCGSNEQHT